MRLIGFIALLLALVGTLRPLPATARPLADAVILSWTDGDTVTVRLKGTRTKVRLLGIDAPEITYGHRANGQAREWGVTEREIMRLGAQSHTAAQRLAVPGTGVLIETDVEKYDRYERLLGYLWLPDGSMLNEQLLRRGWAVLLTIPPNVQYVDRFVAAQQAARKAGAGIWAHRPAPAAQPAPRSNPECDASYPTVCIPPPPPDLDCSDIPYRRFQVVGEDPHRFDGDGDGIGCEK